MKSVEAFKGAVVAALQADAAVAALVGNAIFDVVPQDQPLPYVWIGAVGASRAPEDCGAPTWNLRMRLYAATDEAGRALAWTISSALSSALEARSIDDDMPEGTGQVAAIWISQGGDVIEPTSPAQTFIDLTATVAG